MRKRGVMDSKKKKKKKMNHGDEDAKSMERRGGRVVKSFNSHLPPNSPNFERCKKSNVEGVLLPSTFASPFPYLPTK